MLLSQLQWEDFSRQRGASAVTRESLLTVVADTAKVKTLVVRRDMLIYLPAKARDHILARVRLMEDVDRPFDRERLDVRKDDIVSWNKFKRKVNSDTIKSIEKCRQVKETLTGHVYQQQPQQQPQQQ